ncbi:MAG: hypothetical protein GW906_08445 [Epsilonproteobacteria bacterium]|nr:hypothetical protein [Campylobacterota bacterium]OIO16700.1 MAG: hypothetical protein AUJ81_03695 [Helicobacteraceae bacterium CG1_02_36_14]PIP11065.1 MAG: hypothetical protein COX50_02555 [Sulfurimonas sp. CG23_combo_of_CG06-09_8_20_14_all_36_33]PIS24161.1 MAG: hypothetical protein COT46_10370 [Sulfurimonas sp. CG08_land_8_20_14_0_20_36_33]PIU33780.1 MAG: hypothetical protein COT05_10625 [Sulfurimonas sp. CG07_land_8_20_14_0_80_36_56]PIV04318.1 MAG: hypothetical protein COS56_05325 [Sulfur
MWLTKLKIAIVEKNTDNLNKLMDDIPQLEDKKEIEEAIYLLKEASAIVQNLKDGLDKSMKQMQKNIKFLRVTESTASSKFDVTT